MSNLERGVFWHAVALGLQLACGCGSSESPPPDDGGGTAEQCPPEPYPAIEGLGITLGEVWVIEPFPSVGAAFNPSVDPTPVWQHEVMTDGPCRLLEFEPSFCDECFQPKVCVANNMCEPYPDQVSAGKLTLTGLHKTIMLKQQFGLYYYVPDGNATGDLFDPGAIVSVAASGAEFESFAVSAVGVSRFEPDLPVEMNEFDDAYFEVPLENGSDHTFTWDPACPGTRMRLTLRAMTSGGHGTPLQAILECDAEDTGSITVSQSMIEALPELPGNQIVVLRDYPPSSLLRYHSGTVAVTGGQAELLVGYEVAFWVNHPAP